MDLSRRKFLGGAVAVAVTTQLPLPKITQSVFDTPVSAQLIRSQIWSAQMKEVFLNDLMSIKYVEVLQDEVPTT